MSILETISSIFNKQGSTPEQQQGTLSSIWELINNSKVGGLQGLLDKFKAAGLGSLADSWVAKGPNPPVAADQLHKVFTPDQLDNFAKSLGTDRHEATNQLADMLPHVVDHLTPNGEVPEQGLDANQALAMLKKSLFG